MKNSKTNNENEYFWNFLQCIFITFEEPHAPQKSPSMQELHVVFQRFSNRKTTYSLVLQYTIYLIYHMYVMRKLFEFF